MATFKLDRQGNSVFKYCDPAKVIKPWEVPPFELNGCVVDCEGLRMSSWFIDDRNNLVFDLGDRWFRPDSNWPNTEGIGGWYSPKAGERFEHVKIVWDDHDKLNDMPAT